MSLCRRTAPLAAALAALLLAGACSADPPSPGSTASTPLATASAPDGPSSAPDGPSSAAVVTPTSPGRTPPDVSVPPGHDGRTPMPVLLLLHGYTSRSAEVDLYFGLQRAAADAGFLYVRPNGTADARGNRFWNATDACCDLAGSGVDDSGYLLGLLDALAAQYPVDPRRLYVMGHSNGGFMALRMACDHADRIAAVVSVAGAMPADRSACTPSAPVSVLQVHGTDDQVVPYRGGRIQGAPFPSAARTAQDWATLDRCAADPARGPDLDVAARADLFGGSRLRGAETEVTAYPGCARGTSVQLWTVRGARHVPVFTPAFGDAVLGFLLAHPRQR